MYHNTATRMDVIWMVLWENSVIFSPLTADIQASLYALENNELLSI